LAWCVGAGVESPRVEIGLRQAPGLQAVLEAVAMPNNLALHGVDHVFGDIRGEVANTLQMAGDGKEIEEPLDIIRTRPDLVLDENVHLAVVLIDLGIRLAHLPGDRRIGFH
jgi:hypothetical protein